MELTTHCGDCATAHAFCASRSPLARPLPCDCRLRRLCLALAPPPPCPRSGGENFLNLFDPEVHSSAPAPGDGRSYSSFRRGEVGKERKMSVRTRTSTYMQPTASTRSKARAPTPRMSPRGITSVTNPADDEHAVGYGTTATKVVRAVSSVVQASLILMTRRR